MEIVYRPGSSTDMEILTSLLENRKTFPQYVGNEDLETRMDAVKGDYKLTRRSWDDSYNFPLLLAEDLKTGIPAGYLMIEMEMYELFSRCSFTRVFDYFLADVENREEAVAHFVRQAETAAEDRGVKKVSFTLCPGDPDGEILKRHGFYIETNRIMKPVERHAFNTPRQKNFRVRPANAADRTFIMLLVAQNTKFQVPPNMEEYAGTIQSGYFDFYSSLSVTDEPGMKFLTVVEKSTDRKAGYLCFQTNPVDAVFSKKTAYLFDINVHRDFWGRYATQRLMREMENRLKDMGFEYVYADISQSNPRPLKTALKSLDYSIFARQWAKKL